MEADITLRHTRTVVDAHKTPLLYIRGDKATGDADQFWAFTKHVQRAEGVMRADRILSSFADRLFKWSGTYFRSRQAW